MKKEELVKFYQTYRLYIFPAVVVLSSLFLIVFAIIPQVTKLIDNQKAIEDLTNKSKFLQDKVSALESYDEKDLSQKVEFVLRAFPSDKDFGNILGLLQQLTTKSGFGITSFSLGSAGSKSGKANSYIVTFQVKGAKALFQTLLDNLENSLRLIRIDNIDLSSNQTAQSFEANLTVEVLYSQLPQNFGTEDSSLPQISKKDEELLASFARMSETVPSSAVTVSSPRGKPNPFE